MTVVQIHKVKARGVALNHTKGAEEMATRPTNGCQTSTDPPLGGARCLMLLIGLLASMEKVVPHEILPAASQGRLEISYPGQLNPSLIGGLSQLT